MQRQPAIEGASGVAGAAPASTFAPLRHHVFLAIWLASIVSAIGSQMQQVGAAWLMTSLAPSAEMVALVTALSTLPILLFAFPAGALADILDRRLVLLGAQLLMFGASGVLALAAYAGLVTPPLLLTLTFLVGTGAAIMAPAWQSAVGDIVPREELPLAVGLNVMAFNIARTLGPAIGGVVIALAGSRLNFALNAASYLAMIAVLASWRPAARTGGLAADSVMAAMRDGAVFALHCEPVRRVMLRAAAFGACSAIVVALMALVARDLLGEGPEIFGVLMACMGGGAVAGAAVLGAMRRRFGTEGLLRLAIVLTAASLATIGLSRSLPVTGLALVAVGAGMVMGLSTFNVAVQMSVPRWVSGRALALYQMCTFGGMTLGAWFWGRVGEEVGIGGAYVACAGALASTLLLAWRLPVRDVGAETLEPAPLDPSVHPWRAPRGVGVVVVIAYRVPACRQRQFVAAATERQRIRLRDGARHVTLLQDANDQTAWSERFRVRSWAEYQRQRARRTLEAKQLDDILADCHEGAAAPVARYFFERRIRPGGGEVVAPYPLG